MKYSIIYLLALGALAATCAQALELTSNDIHEGQKMSSTFEFHGSDCNGGNVSPQLSWNNIPKGTKSFAITAYDPDAPTGSGWWHWSVINIPTKVTHLKRGAKLKKLHAIQLRNDFGIKEFSGACPPKGEGMHRYQFTLWALPSNKLDISPDASPAMAGFMLNSVALDKAILTATDVR